MAQLQGQSQSSQGPSLQEINRVLQRMAELESIVGQQTKLLLTQHATIFNQKQSIAMMRNEIDAKEKG